MFGHWWEADDCAYGILYRDQMANLSNLQVPRITVGESYRKIFEDLEPGLKHLPDFTTPRYLSKQLAQVLKAKLLLNRGVMRGDVQDLKDALDLVLTVKKDAPGSWKIPIVPGVNLLIPMPVDITIPITISSTVGSRKIPAIRWLWTRFGLRKPGIQKMFGH